MERAATGDQRTNCPLVTLPEPPLTSALTSAPSAETSAVVRTSPPRCWQRSARALAFNRRSNLSS